MALRLAARQRRPRPGMAADLRRRAPETYVRAPPGIRTQNLRSLRSVSVGVRSCSKSGVVTGFRGHACSSLFTGVSTLWLRVWLRDVDGADGVQIGDPMYALS
jgi:hypothetical protein